VTDSATELRLAALALLLAAGPGTAYGQDPASAGATIQGEAGAEAPASHGPRTLFTIDGTAVHIWSSVPVPYAGSAYRDDLGGQPMSSGESIFAPGGP